MKLRAALGAVVLLGLLASSASCGPGKFADESAPLNVGAPLTSSDAAPAVPSSAAVFPMGIRIPTIGLNNREFMQVGLVNKELEVPPLSQPRLIGWFKLSPVPGESALCSFVDGCVQPSVIVSHVNGNGVQGGFAKLSQIKVGATVEIDRSDQRTAVFKVAKVRTLLKTAFDTKGAYGIAGPSLTMITCGPGQIINGSYLNQTVVTADLVTVKPTVP